jgi:ABC-type sugar transport system ATPase subunit
LTVPGPTSLVAEPTDPEMSVLAPICEVRRLSKRYGGLEALDDVSLAFRGGEVHAVLGENGAGKSTLMKILAGAERADQGTVLIGGEEQSFGNGADANAAGVAIVFQELSLYPDLDVLSNLLAGREPRRWGLVQRAEMERRVRPVLAQIGLDVDLKARVETLRLDERQLLEIGKALLVDARVLILDEPTSALTQTESDRLFEIVRRLRADGRAIVFVSHRLQEVFEVADVVTVLRDGKHIRTVLPGETSVETLVADMIGRRPAAAAKPAPAARVAESVLRVEDASVAPVLDGLSLDVGRSEVLGLAGLEGCGIRPLYEAIFGLRTIDGGRISLSGGKLPRSPLRAVKAGVAYVPADRREAGLMLEQSIAANMCHVSAGVTRAFGPFISRRAMRSAAEETCRRLGVRAHSMDAPVERLSGGNQQKIVLGKWLQVAPVLVLLDDPTRGVDVGAKFEIYELIRELAASGCAILFHSTELGEYEQVCHRAVVIRRGRVTGGLGFGQLSEHTIARAINGDTSVELTDGR